MSKPRDLVTFEKNYKNQFNQSAESRLKKKNRIGCTPRRICRYLWSEVKHLFHNYCETTAMHGFRNIAVSRLILEKLVWAVICFAAVAFSLLLIGYSYKNRHDRLTLIQLTTDSAPLNTLNFPAVTVCNHNRIYKPAADAMSSTLLEAGYSNETIQNFFTNMSLLVRPSYRPSEPEEFNNMLNLLDNNLKNLMLRIYNIEYTEKICPGNITELQVNGYKENYGRIFNLMQPCDNLLKTCFWIGNSYNCSLMFKTVDSFMGHCCGFNYQVATTYADNNKSPECIEFYLKYNPDNKVQCEGSECPGRKELLKTPGSGIDVGLTVELDIEVDHYLASTRNYMGARIIIHEAFDYPETDILTATIQPDQEANIVVTGTVIESLDEIRFYSSKERKCIFLDEVGYIYSYQSCIAGCKMNRILQTCDCIPYFYPETCIRMSRPCDFQDVDCLKKNFDNITKIYEDVTLDNGQVLEKCRCKQVCSKTSYSISVDKNRINHPDYYLPWNVENNTIDRSKSKFNVYFQYYGYTKYTRSLFIAWDDVIANYGGILGFCFGGSLIGIMEPVIYFLLTPFRIHHHRQIRQARESKKRAKEESKNQFRDFPSASKLFKRVSADKKLVKEWKENSNNIFVVGDNFKRSEHQRRKKQESNNEKISASENVKLFHAHFF